jgi:hypothetical protein
MDRKKAAMLITNLSSSTEPAVRYKIRVGVLNEDPTSKSLRGLQEEIKKSSLVRTLLRANQTQRPASQIERIYKKWTGPHWTIASLADLGYPPGDPDLKPIRDRVLDGRLDPLYTQTIHFDETPPYNKLKGGVPIVQGRARRCASQQGNALYSSLKLGFMDDRCDQLAELLIGWQWPDGGWNCDKRTEAIHSSFWESLLPLRGLAIYSQITGDKKARSAIVSAAEVFLQRRLFKRLIDGSVMNKQFIYLRYPNYWRYNILIGLLVMSEAGFLEDPRCEEALDLLESKQLADGGWPAEDRFYQNTKPEISGYSPVNWGGVSKRKMNPWVTADALTVLQRAGRY